MAVSTSTVEDVLSTLTEEQIIIVTELHALFEKQSGIIASVKRGCLHYQFRNGMWCYINCRKKKYPVLGFSRGNRMVRDNPLLSGLFDDVMTVVAKVFVYDVNTVQRKGIAELLDYVQSLPSGIGVK